MLIIVILLSVYGLNFIRFLEFLVLYKGKDLFLRLLVDFRNVIGKFFLFLVNDYNFIWMVLLSGFLVEFLSLKYILV